MSQTEGRFPFQPSARARGKALPIVDLAGKMLRCEDGRRGHHHKFDVGDGHACPLCLLLGILQHVDVLGDAVRLHVVLVHVCSEGDHVHGMEAPAVCIEERDDLEGSHLRVEGVRVLEVVEPDLVDGLVEELGGSSLCRLVTGIVVEAGFMGCFRADTDDSGGIAGASSAMLAS